MMIKKLIFFLVVNLFFEVAFSQSFHDTIPFRNDLGLIIIPVTFNGIEKQFAFDTGAQYSVAYGWPEDELKKTNKSLTISSSSNRKSRMRFYKSGVIELGSRKIRGHRILNAPNNEIFDCFQVDGILGVDIIKELNWKIDCQQKLLIMYTSNFFPKEVKQMHELDFVFERNRPFIYLKRKKNRFKFLLDTGAGGYSNVSSRNYNLKNTEELIQSEFYSGSYDVNGIFTATNPKVLQFPEMTSKSVSLLPIIFYNNQKSSKIGNKLWKNRSIFLSLNAGRLYSSSQIIRNTYIGYSVVISYQKGAMRVINIEVDSEAWNFGVRQGDEVLEIDGKKFNDFCSLDVYRRSISKTGKPFVLTLKSGKKITIEQEKSFAN